MQPSSVMDEYCPALDMRSGAFAGSVGEGVIEVGGCVPVGDGPGVTVL